MKFTALGGLAVRLKNGTGGNSVKGNVVHITSDDTVVLAPQGEPDPIGVFLDSDIPDGEYAWIVMSGIAEVYFIGDSTAGHLARTFVAADADFVIGQAKSEAIPTSPFATDKHFCEIGHVLQSRVGAGLAKVLLHFN